MPFTVDGRIYRRNTEIEDWKLAEAIHGTVKTQIIEGKCFDKALNHR